MKVDAATSIHFCRPYYRDSGVTGIKYAHVTKTDCYNIYVVI
jgi:hypothetical protein